MKQNNPHTEPLLANTDTARSMLGNIGKTKLFELLREGKLERVKLGGKTCITIASIRAVANLGGSS